MVPSNVKKEFFPVYFLFKKPFIKYVKCLSLCWQPHLPPLVAFGRTLFEGGGLKFLFTQMFYSSGRSTPSRPIASFTRYSF